MKIKPETSILMVRLPFQLPPNSLLLSISPCPPCYSLCSTNKWNHMIIDSLCLIYFTKHNLLLSHPCWYKSWVFILSDGGTILHSIYGPRLLYPFVCWRAIVTKLWEYFIYLFIRERESKHVHKQGRGRGRDRLPAEQGTWWVAPSQDPEIMTWAEGGG